MPVQVRTRITLFLPAPTVLSQHLLVNDVMSQLITTCEGATVTVDTPPVIKGLWLDAGVVVEDLNLLIQADAPLRSDNRSLWITSVGSSGTVKSEPCWITGWERHSRSA
jgi:hypothetical protein